MFKKSVRTAKNLVIAFNTEGRQIGQHFAESINQKHWRTLWKQHNVPADGLAFSNVVWYDTGVPGILIVSMDNVTYLHLIWITDPIPL